MRAAIYVACPPGPIYEQELVKARAFCVQQGLVPTKVYQLGFLQDDRQCANFFAAVREGTFEILVGPFPDCFPTRFLKQLLAAKVGVACYGA
jgi:hypothetical protein